MPYLDRVLVKTAGIVLRNLKYGDSSLIVDLYSRELGLQSYIISGARKPRSAMPASLFQVMNQLDMIVYHHDKPSLKRIKEAVPRAVYRRIPVDIRHSAVGVFLVEVVRNALIHTESHPALYDYLQDMFLLLDEPRQDMAVFPLRVMLELTHYLGFQPGEAGSAEDRYFDLMEGGFRRDAPEHMHYLTPDQTRFLEPLREPLGFERMPAGLNAEIRRNLLDGLILYYKLHLDHFRDPKSREILQQVLAG